MTKHFSDVSTQLADINWSVRTVQYPSIRRDPPLIVTEQPRPSREGASPAMLAAVVMLSVFLSMVLSALA